LIGVDRARIIYAGLNKFLQHLASPLLGRHKEYNSVHGRFCHNTKLCGFVMTKNVAIVYWGSRGGGPRHLLNLVRSKQKEDSQLFFYVSSNNELIHELQAEAGSQLEIASIPHSKFRVLTDLRSRKSAIKKVIADFEDKEISRVYFLLPHPWDLYLAKKIMNKGEIEVWRGIHDLKRHPGDVWPNSFTIRRLIKYSNNLVCFSSYIEKQLLRHGKTIVRSHLFEVNRESKGVALDGSVLFVGRIRKYKGLVLLARAWPLITNSKKSLTVAGAGRITPELQRIGVRLINRWLTNSEIDNLIRKSNLVVMPHVEASQSGVIAIAHSLSTPVVVTPVGGLMGQVIEGRNGIIAASVTPESLAAAIDNALATQWSLESEENPLPHFLADLQKFI
jgi:glycosyltransferase involved in cell wall biosynthesis